MPIDPYNLRDLWPQEAIDDVKAYREKRRREVQVPGILDRVNYIVNMWQNPCGASWLIYLETMWPAFLELIIALSLAGWDDVVRGYFRPGKLTKRHRARGEKKRPGKWGQKWQKVRGWVPIIGEPAGEIGKNIPGASNLRSRKITDGVRFLWIVDGILQRLMWWWMVIDAFSEFLYRWTTLLNRTEACQATQTAWATATDSQIYCNEISGWHAFYVAETHHANHGAKASYGGIQHPSPNATAVAGANWKPANPEHPTSVQLKIVDADTGSALDHSSWAMTSADRNAGAITRANLGPNKAASVLMRATNGTAVGSDCTIHVTGPVPPTVDVTPLFQGPSEL